MKDTKEFQSKRNRNLKERFSNLNYNKQNISNAIEVRVKRQVAIRLQLTMNVLNE